MGLFRVAWRATRWIAVVMEPVAFSVCVDSSAFAVLDRSLGMAKQFRPVDRDQQFLLPVDMRDWLPDEHQVWLVLDVVEQLDLTVLRSRYRLGGVGRQAYDPVMLLALLVYGYCQGVRSSRAIERACHTDVAFRVLCGQDPPDHTRIARFRQAHLDLFEDLFTQVLIVCAKAGFVRLGIVAIDGTKIAANASIDASHERAYYQAKVAAMTGEAAMVDAAEDTRFGLDRRGDEPPEGMSGRGAAGRAERAARLRRCLDEITAADAARDAVIAAEQDTAAQYLADARAGRVRRGQPPRGVTPVQTAEARLDRYIQQYGPGHRYVRKARRALTAAVTDAERNATEPKPPKDRKTCRHGKTCRRSGCLPAPVQRNSTDPDSRIMPTRKGFIQGYNAQLAASEDHFIIAGHLVQDPGDVEQLQPMLASSTTAAETLRTQRRDPDAAHASIGIALADNGYCSDANLTAPGPDRLIATGKTRDLHHTATTNPATGPPPDTAAPHEAMQHRLSTPDGAALYKKRGATIEPINGHLKDCIGLRAFLLRGLHACQAELHLAALTHNIRRLHTLTTST
ncbi:transposase [Dactylosporangium aurantiacum]|uniref:Transposase n=1 Tax=Dactylosporangium aurantiacum TaxID=35754 RepID=A0A9Q9IKB7_9ACTN|nr:transposase [Dactylosporangium aurantiacum]UWZ56418.1 transposase [Dactylosporangium aurantiacum]